MEVGLYVYIVVKDQERKKERKKNAGDNVFSIFSIIILMKVVYGDRSRKIPECLQ